MFLALMMFSLCVILLVGARLAMIGARRSTDVRSFMVGGFEAGMLGYALFVSVFGSDALPVFAAVDLGQVLFVFIVLMPILAARVEEGSSESRVFAAAFARICTSPVIWSIVVGLVVGIITRNFDLPSGFFVPVSAFLEILGNLTVPIIAIAIGFELSFDRTYIGRALRFVLARKAVLVGVAVIMIRYLPANDDLTPYAFLTMLLLPPPYVVTLAAKDGEQALVSSILSVSTIVSIAAFVGSILVVGAI